MNRSRIFIFGSSGFVGANLLRFLLKENYEVGVLLRKSSNLWRIGDKVHQLEKYFGDASSLEAVSSALSDFGPDVVINTMNYGGAYGEADVERIVDTNIKGLTHVLEVSNQRGVDLFINTGSYGEYGVKNGEVNEECSTYPIGEYCISKLLGTLYCKHFALSRQLNVVNLRLFQVYGFYENPIKLMPSTMVALLKEKEPGIRNPTAKRDFVFIEDVIDAYGKIIKDTTQIHHGDIFNIGTSVPHTVSEVVSKLALLLTNKSSGGNVCGELRSEDSLNNYVADISKIRSVYSWKPQFSLDRGLATYVEWFKENVHQYVEK